MRPEKCVPICVMVNPCPPKFTLNVSLNVSQNRNGHHRDARNLLKRLVAREGVEPPTHGFSVRRNASHLVSYCNKILNFIGFLIQFVPQ
jgi:hypothetical protein